MQIALHHRRNPGIHPGGPLSARNRVMAFSSSLAPLGSDTSPDHQFGFAPGFTSGGPVIGVFHAEMRSGATGVGAKFETPVVTFGPIRLSRAGCG